MRMSLARRLVLRSVVVFCLGAAMLFLPAGSLRFWQGWILLALAFVMMVWFSLHFYHTDPAFLERRLRSKETIPEQRILMNIWGTLFIVAFLLPRFDYRFGWSRRWVGAVPLWLNVLAMATILAGYGLIGRAFRVNRFASRTVDVDEGQNVVSTGPYRFIRHPQYCFLLPIMLSIPLALGSFVALPVFALMIPMIILRLLNEEKFLREHLPGYREYCEQTRYRLVPGVW